MPQRFLSIKNLEKYQTNRKQNPPWFKIHRVMFGDPEFIKLTPAQRFLYIGLIHLAVESRNKIYNDSTFIGQRLYIHHTEVDLKPLYRAGFLHTTNLSRVLSETERERETEERREEPTVKPQRASMTDEEWVEELKKNPAYTHINFPVELGKMDAWLALPKNKGRHKTRRFILNWLNKIERPMTSPGVVAPQHKCAWTNDGPCQDYAEADSRYCAGHRAKIKKAQERMVVGLPVTRQGGA